MIVNIEVDGEEGTVLQNIMDANRMKKVLQEFDQQIYANTIHSRAEDPPEVQQIYLDIQDMFRYICQSNNIYIYKDGR